MSEAAESPGGGAKADARRAAKAMQKLQSGFNVHYKAGRPRTAGLLSLMAPVRERHSCLAQSLPLRGGRLSAKPALHTLS